MQIKQVDCKKKKKKMSTKKNLFKKTFGDIFGKLHTQESKATKKVESEASAQPWS